MAVSKELHVYFGGSFDPPHLGHEQMLLTLLSDSLADQVHLVPTFQNPLKGHAQGLSGDEKRTLTKLWAASAQRKVSEHDFSKLHLEFSELESAGRSYTYETLSELMQKNAGVWALAIGSDLLSELHKWHEIASLLHLLHSVWIFPRIANTDTLEVLPQELRALTHWRWINQAIENVSSTQIRIDSEENQQDFDVHTGLATFAKDFYRTRFQR